MAYLNRITAQKLMQAKGLDALILFSPEAFAHATGTSPGVATMWRREGAVAVLIPADPDMPETVVVSDLFAAGVRRESHIQDVRDTPIWVEAMTLADPDLDGSVAVEFAPVWGSAHRPVNNDRPETFDPDACFRHLRDALSEKHMQASRVGVELDAVSAQGCPALSDALAPAQIVDATAIARSLRAMKSPEEIALLRSAVRIAETGIAAVRDAVTVGVARSDLAEIWKETVAAHGANSPMTGAWEYISVGPDPWGGDAIAKSGDLIKVDVGCVMKGYTSDTGRTFVVGPPRRLHTELHEALMTGFRAGFALLHPGVALAEVHRATQSAIRSQGLAGYCRGHFGHGLGTGPGTEEWPFISAQAETRIESGMVLAFECPIYVTGVGGMIIEDQIEITDAGPVSMNSLSRDLVSC
ncbi:M24 family metallopeptidase [Pseudosulfitobacter koreensis]|uniref:Xaa-Pro peptidase family protein n=1 Tax=Pseudosulfitobacter koreensis TaxID=2968472 RepID=A0ABT1Z0J3_9RHOB|nr:Xaa-Pro peptidase family protein [Pseudosulfitobacter koreense]MCR8826668.1 Xaa-Pro peptidase family protein [Pseudosulfitobacter koreense]